MVESKGKTIAELLEISEKGQCVKCLRVLVDENDDLVEDSTLEIYGTDEQIAVYICSVCSQKRFQKLMDSIKK